MDCPHCGALIDPAGATFCPSCRKRVLAPSWNLGSARTQPAGLVAATAPAQAVPHRQETAWRPVPPAFERPRAITLLAALDLLTALIALGMGGVAVYASTLNTSDDRAFLAGLGVVFVLLAFLHFMAGLGLLGLKSWGRFLQIAIAIVSLLGIPIGTVMGALLLAWFFKPGARSLFSGGRPLDLPEDERTAAQQAARETGIVTAAAVIGLGFVGCAGVGIAAAIAIPSLLVARVATNESAAIADLRAVVSAQAAYQSANGHYDRLECLSVPSACIPGYPATGPTFLQGTFVSNPERSGYRFHLEPGPSPVNLSVSRSSASSMDRYAYLAAPVQLRTTGRRIFCADDTGRVCAFTDLAARRVEDGRCSSECADVR